MKLGEVLPYFSEYANIYVKDVDSGEEIAKYDGKDSIPEELNNRELDESNSICPESNNLYVYVKGE